MSSITLNVLDTGGNVVANPGYAKLQYQLAAQGGLFTTLQATLIGTSTRICKAGYRIVAREGAKLRWAGTLVEVAGKQDGSVDVGAVGDGVLLDKDVFGGTALGKWYSDNTLAANPEAWVKADGLHPDRFNVDNNNRLYIGLKKGATYAISDYAGWKFRAPFGSLIKRVDFTYQFAVPSGVFRLQISANSGAFGLWSAPVAATGGPTNVSVQYAAGINDLTFILQNVSGAASTPSGEEGDNFARITQIALYSDEGGQECHARYVLQATITEMAARVDAGAANDWSGLDTRGGYNDLVQEARPTGYWRLVDKGGVALDSAGTSNGTYNGSRAVGTGGLLVGDSSTHIKLDGSSGWVSAPHNAAHNIGSKDATWIILGMLAGAGGGVKRTLIAKGNQVGTGGQKIYVNGANRIQFDEQLIAMLVTGSAVLGAGTFHVVVTKAATTYTIYLNGYVDAAATTATALASTTAPLTIGATYENSLGPSEFFPNWIGEAALIVGRAITAAEVTALYNASRVAAIGPASIPASYRAQSYTAVLADLARLGDGASVPARMIYGVEPMDNYGRRGKARLYYRPLGGLRYVIDARDASQLAPTTNIRNTPTDAVVDYQDYNSARQFTGIASVTAAGRSPVIRMLIKRDGQEAATTAQAVRDLALYDANQRQGVGTIKLAYPVYDLQKGMHVPARDVQPGYMAMLPTRAARALVASGGLADGYNLFAIEAVSVDGTANTVSIETAKDANRLARYLAARKG